ncbi:hypothetical protein [Desulfolucanica intricata]|uniref:hypothetical protein n=1 Tax=Desulfolucanica intricata TaxID=1285191 RepID=UPI00082AA839|nr:hypothetical protein [Desulfolucanica intricata]
MAKKIKIKKNLTDEDMLASYIKNYKAEPSFEDIFDDTKPDSNLSQKESFLSNELREKISKALLELKIKLYNDGIIDFDIKVTCEGHQVLLTAVPLSEKRNKKIR